MPNKFLSSKEFDEICRELAKESFKDLEIVKDRTQKTEDNNELQKKEGKKVHQELHFYRAYSVEEPHGELGRINYFIVK